jgi:peroxiredoxin
MCANRFTDRTDLRVHLMCDHRKSALVDEFLGAVETKHELYRSLRKTERVVSADS